MNIKFINSESSNKFALMMEQSTYLKQWILNNLTRYSTNDNLNLKHTLNIMLDTHTKNENNTYDFYWSIQSVGVDEYGIETDEPINRINGGLICRGYEDKQSFDQYGEYITKTDLNYSSHT